MAHARDDDDGGRVPRRDEISALLIAGGRSRRMGRPKPWLVLGDTPLLARVAARVRPLVREIVVVAAAEQELPPLADARIVRDPVPEEGPLAALATGLATIRTPWAFALACDGPFLRRAVLRRLVDEAPGAAAVVPAWEGEVQPLVALYHRRLTAAVAALVAAGERRLQTVGALPGVRLLPPERLRDVDPEGASFRTLNTPEEYAAALAAWSEPDD